MSEIKGGCLCGAIRYSCDAEGLASVICNCKNCQKQSGSAYSLNLLVPRNALKVEGSPSVYEDTADSGNTLKRYFCPQCGSNLYSEPSGNPDVSVLKVGTMDDTSGYAPQVAIYCDSAQTWLDFGEMPQVPKMPPA